MTPEERAELDSLKIQFAAFLAGTLSHGDLTGAQRKTIQDSLYPILNGYRNCKAPTNFDYTAWEAGDEVQHIDGTNKNLTIGQVINTPFNPTTDLNDRSKFDWYVDAKPKLAL